jgi:hypothetical protein
VSVARPLHTTHGIDLFEKPDGWVYGHRGSDLAGWTFHNGAEWRARRTCEPYDYRVASRHAGIAYFVGGCPDCVCNPVLCAADDTGESCLDCGFCMHGCSADEHPAVGSAS